MLFSLFLVSFGAYLPNRVLIIADQDAELLKGYLSVGEVPVEIQTTQNGEFALPKLYEGGTPVYSHIVLFGNSLKLRQEDAEALGAYSDGRLDPLHSRLTALEKVTLPLDQLKNNSDTLNPQNTANGTKTILANNYTLPGDKKFSGVFEPLPGGNIMILSSNPSMEALLQKLGAGIARGVQNNSALSLQYVKSDIWVGNNNAVREVSLGDLTQKGQLIIKRFRNRRIPFNSLVCTKKDFCLAAAWRGVVNNARISYFGHDGIVNATLDGKTVGEQATTIMTTISRWFMFNTGVIRAKEFNYNLIDIPNSKCAQKLHLSQAYGDRLREGNLILLKLRLEQFEKKGWIPKEPSKTYNSFQQMVDVVGYPNLSNPNFKSVIKKQKASFELFYDTCIQESLESYLGLKINDKDYVYTSFQFRERFIQDWYVMNMIYHAKSGSYYALIVPDLTRSYSISADIDINSASRLNIKMRIHVRPTRLENERITASNLPWQVALAFTSILSFMTALVNIIEKDVVVEVVKEVEKPQKQQKKNK